MDCRGHWISLTAVKFSCQDQAWQRTETPANGLSAAVSITTEPWVHRSKGTKRVHIASCLDFHGFINLFSREGREPAKRKAQCPQFLTTVWVEAAHGEGNWGHIEACGTALSWSHILADMPFQGWPSLWSPWGQGMERHTVDFLLCPAAYLH